jgi:hypothetical protein
VPESELDLGNFRAEFEIRARAVEHRERFGEAAFHSQHVSERR